jgi:hypothetical protein
MTKSRRMRWVEHVVNTGEKRKACRVLVRKPEGKRPLGRPTCKWDDNIKMEFREIGMGWYGLDRLIWFRIGTSRRLL